MERNERIALSPKLRYYVMVRDNFACQYCGRSSPNVELHIDHVVPLARGGANDTFNLLTSCAGCNLSKQANPLPSNVIRDKQEGILQRTKAYNIHIEEQPNIKPVVSSPKNQRPTKLLNKYPSIEEPLKGRTLNENKRHCLVFAINTRLELSVQYYRHDKSGWQQSSPIQFNNQLKNNVLNPLTADAVEVLHNQFEFEEVDMIEEFGTSVQLLSSESALHIITVKDSHHHMCCAVWVPIQSVEFALAIESSDYDDGADEYYSTNY